MILYIYSKQMHTFIIDEYGIFRSRKQPKHILEDLCMLYGSTMEGRKRAVSDRLMIVQMVPILISDKTKDLFFPIWNDEDGYWWLNYRLIQNVYKGKGQHTIVFHNGRELLLHCEVRSLMRQLRRCALYNEVLERDTVEDYVKQYQKIEEIS